MDCFGVVVGYQVDDDGFNDWNCDYELVEFVMCWRGEIECEVVVEGDVGDQFDEIDEELCYQCDDGGKFYVECVNDEVLLVECMWMLFDVCFFDQWFEVD